MRWCKLELSIFIQSGVIASKPGVTSDDVIMAEDDAIEVADKTLLWVFKCGLKHSIYKRNWNFTLKMTI